MDGQSNALSNPETGGVILFEPSERVKFWHRVDKEWVVATNDSLVGVNPDVDIPRYNFALDAAKKLSEHYDRDVYFVPNALGGANIDLWLSELEGNRFDLSRDLILESGATNVISLWHQGEANNRDTPDEYTQKMDNLETLLFSEDWHSGLIVYGELFYGGMAGTAVSDVQNPQIQQRDYVASAFRLTSLDNLHFDSPSKRILGERYADEVIRSGWTP